MRRNFIIDYINILQILKDVIVTITFAQFYWFFNVDLAKYTEKNFVCYFVKTLL